MEGVVQGVQGVARPLFDKPSLLNPSFPLIKSFGYDFEVRVPEEEPDDGPVHQRSLLLALLREVPLDVLLAVAVRPQEVPQSLHPLPHLVPLQDHLALSLKVKIVMKTCLH